MSGISLHKGVCLLGKSDFDFDFDSLLGQLLCTSGCALRIVQGVWQNFFKRQIGKGICTNLGRWWGSGTVGCHPMLIYHYAFRPEVSRTMGSGFLQWHR